MLIAKEGWREMALATLILGASSAGAAWIWWPLAIPLVIVWGWVISFFRDPRRERAFADGELCSAADGTVTEISRLEHHDAIGGPAIRIGVFLSLFNVHVNRSPCSGTVRSRSYRAGQFLDARHPESGTRNESNTLLLDPDEPMPGPIEVRQVAGLVARRIICNVQANQHMPIGMRFGIIKFGSRTELVFPQTEQTQIAVQVGDKVQGGLTVVARQPVGAPSAKPDRSADSTTPAGRKQYTGVQR